MITNAVCWTDYALREEVSMHVELSAVSSSHCIDLPKLDRRFRSSTSGGESPSYTFISITVILQNGEAGRVVLGMTMCS